MATVSQSQMLPEAVPPEDIVCIIGLKSFVRTHFASDSSFRMLILSEPDYLPRREFVIKVGIFVKLLYQETGSRNGRRAVFTQGWVG